MRLLIDTHILLWWLFDDPKLGAGARERLADLDNIVLVSAASAWEIATKARLGKLPEAGDVPEALGRYVARCGFTELPVSLAHAQSAGLLPGPHQDPFDRMLIAQAQLESIPLITDDPTFKSYDVTILT